MTGRMSRRQVPSQAATVCSFYCGQRDKKRPSVFDPPLPEQQGCSVRGVHNNKQSFVLRKASNIVFGGWGRRLKLSDVACGLHFMDPVVGVEPALPAAAPACRALRYRKGARGCVGPWCSMADWRTGGSILPGREFASHAAVLRSARPVPRTTSELGSAACSGNVPCFEAAEGARGCDGPW